MKNFFTSGASAFVNSESFLDQSIPMFKEALYAMARDVWEE